VFRYYFNIRRLDREDSDLRGVALPNDAAVLDHALCIIKDLRQGGEHNDPGLMLIVRNESLQRYCHCRSLRAVPDASCCQ
jgi:hypothetical protein